jgi:twitching motility protein PilT
VIRGVVSQRLVPKSDGIGRVPAVEVLVSTARVKECIVDKDKTNEINDAISKGYTTYGMQSFDQSLMLLMKENFITYEEALKHCTNPDDFALRVKGILSASDGTWDDFEDLEKEKEKEKEKVKEDDKKLKFGKPGDPSVPEGGGTGLKR